MNARPGFVVALVLAAVVAPLFAWWMTGTESMDRLQMRLLARAAEDLSTQEHRLAARAADRLEALRASESARPWYHYQDYYNDPRARAEGLALFPSPLAGGTKAPLVAAHVSLASDAPPWQSGEPALAEGGFAQLLAAAGSGGGQVERLERGSYEQNVRQDVLGKGARHAGRTAPVPIEVMSFRWTALGAPEEPGLAAVRRVETPDGWRVQAFTIDRAELESWLSQSARVRIVPEGRRRGAPIPLEGCAWRVVLTEGQLAGRAVERAALLRSRFVRTFLLGGSLAVLGGLAAGLLIAQSGRLARLRATFAAAAAHELRTPLASLRLQAELLQEQVADEAARVRAGRIVSESARLSRVVSNILGATRLERGGIAASVAAGDLAAEVGAIVEEQRAGLEARGVEVSLSGADAPLPARFDAEALAHVVGNLLDNAERHGRAGTVRRVHVRLARGEDGSPRLLVSDTGPGVPDALRATIFEPYVSAGDPARGGLGLGLPIARALCRAMGGDLRWIDETPGATFEIRLPGG